MTVFFILFVSLILACITAVCTDLYKAVAVFVITFVLVSSTMMIAIMLFNYQPVS